MNQEITPRSYLKETLKMVASIEGAFLSLAERLYTIREERLYEGEYETFEEFLLTAKLSKATASKLCLIYSTFVLKYKISHKKLAEVGWSALYTVAGYADTKERATELVERAGLLTRGDLEVSLRNEDGKQERCAHEWILYKFCTKCSQKHRVYDR